MGQVLHGSAKTTHAVRAAIQRSKASIQALSQRYDLNPKTVMKWKKRDFVHDAPMGPKAPRSTVLSPEEEALIVAFRKHTLLPLDDCLYALQATIPQLTRSSLHRLRGMTSAGCRASKETGHERGSRPTQLAISTSTSPNCTPKKASSTCS
jgi:transposase-like protein